MSGTGRDPLLGRRLGDYVVEKKLGEGAMGAVYRAVDVNLRRQVALKVLRQRLSEDLEYVDRLKREARAVARLNHPNIVHIWSWGTDAGLTYFALELVLGGSVASMLGRAGGKLPVRRACEIARDAALGLAAAHAEGVVHRDVKPDNMLLEVPHRSSEGVIALDDSTDEAPHRKSSKGAPDESWLAANFGRVKLADFGIARDVSAGQRITETGLFIGTPRYASPEQCDAQPVDGRSDLYSLGVSLYEFLTGTVPHEGTRAMSLLSRIRNEPPRPIRDANPDVPEPIAAIVHRLLEKKPGERYPDGAALARDLDSAIGAMPTSRFEVQPPAPEHDEADVVVVAPTLADGAGGAPGGAEVTYVSDEGRRPPTGPGRTQLLTDRQPSSVAGRRLGARLAMIDRLAESGHPIAALRAAALVVPEVVHAADQDASGALYATLGKVVAMLRDPGARFRAVPSLVTALEAFRLADIGLAILAGELADLLRERVAVPLARAATRPVHATAIVHLTELAVGLTLPWKWDELVGAYDDAVVPLDPEGRQQVLAAATVLMGLVEPREHESLRAFNERRQIVPVVSLRNVGAIQGTSAGLPTLLAMLAARFGLVPRHGVAATGALDAATIPPLPTLLGAGAPDYERFLDVRIREVEALVPKVQAVVEQCPDVDVIVLPRGNERHVREAPDLQADLASCGVKLVFVETVRDVLAAKLLEPDLEGPPFREAGRAPRAAPADSRLAAALSSARWIAAGALALLALSILRAVS